MVIISVFYTIFVRCSSRTIVTKKDLRTLARADLVIVEATEESLSVGYKIATAVQLKKPVLIMIRKDALSTNTSLKMVSALISIILLLLSNMIQIVFVQ